MRLWPLWVRTDLAKDLSLLASRQFGLCERGKKYENIKISFHVHCASASHHRVAYAVCVFNGTLCLRWHTSKNLG